MNTRALLKKKILKYSQIFFYLGFLFVWFKDSFPKLHSISLSPWLFFFPLVAITAVRIWPKIHQKRPFLANSALKKEVLGIIILLCIATLVRIPFLSHSYGLINSDDGISALQSKHISEGKTRAIYFYGQHYMGSFPFHVYAAAFKVFGYSIFLYVFIYLLFFLAFMVMQYLLFREIFSSRTMAFVLTSFYVLPLGHLLSMSFYVGANFTVVFFLGSLSIYLAYLVYTQKRDTFIPWIGFLLGLGFWTHPISIGFMICAALFVVFRLRLCVKRYFAFIGYFLVGVFPVILYEAGTHFQSLRYAFRMNRARGFLWSKIAQIIENLPTLVSMDNSFLNAFYVLLIFSGIIGIVIFSVLKHKFLPENIFVVFFLVFLAIYTASRFPADVSKLRYLYPFYFCLPVLLVAIINRLRHRLKFLMMAILFLSIFLASNAGEVWKSYHLTKQADITLNRMLQSMESTGEKYWAATFWEAALLSALSGERFECTSRLHFTEGRHVPWRYRLSYFNQSQHTNYLFLKEAGGFAVRFKEIMPLIQDNFAHWYQDKDHVIALLDKLKINAEIVKDEKFTLVYKSEVPLMPEALKSDIPSSIPELKIQNIFCERRYINLKFEWDKPVGKKGFRVFVEIPDYSKTSKGISPDKLITTVRVPYPVKPAFKVNYGLIYHGIKLPSSQKTMIYYPTQDELKQPFKRIMFLSGVGPKFSVFDKNLRMCEKKVRIQIGHPQKIAKKVRICLYSLFDFMNPFWYGKFNQDVRIEMNAKFMKQQLLKYGKNIIELDLPPSLMNNQHSSILTLDFKYEVPFQGNRHWCAAAFLDQVEFQ